GEIGQTFDCAFRAAKLIDEHAERARPDIFRADQAQPVHPLFVAQANGVKAAHFEAPIFGSVPANNRPILARCLYQTNPVSSAKRSAASIFPSENKINGVARHAI